MLAPPLKERTDKFTNTQIQNESDTQKEGYSQGGTLLFSSECRLIYYTLLGAKFQLCKKGKKRAR